MEKGIRLRAIEPEDSDFMWIVENDYDQWSVSDTVAPLSKHQILQYALSYDSDPFNAGQLRLIIETSDGTPIGIVDLYEMSRHHGRAYVGIYVKEDLRKEGYGKATIEKITDYAFNTLGLHQLAARILPHNTAAARLFSSCGFRPAGRLRSWHFANGHRYDVQLLQLLNPRSH